DRNVTGVQTCALPILKVLFYASTFIFTGLSVSIAMKAGLFNIGSEGQLYIGGLGLTMVMLAFDQTLPALLLIPLAMIGAAVFGEIGRASCREGVGMGG